MKSINKRHSKSALSVLLSLCLLASCVTAGISPANAVTLTPDESVGDNTQTVYFTPYTGANGTGWIMDNKTILARYLPGDNDWQTRQAYDTGRTIGGKRVYYADLQDRYSGLDQLYFRAGSSITDYDQTSNEIHPITQWVNNSEFKDKYYNGSSWDVPTYDTYVLKNGDSTVATFAYSSGLEYTATANLTGGTTYSFYLSDGTNTWRNQISDTYDSTTTKNMYKYDSDNTNHVFKVKATASGTYTFKWTLNGAGSRCDAGSLEVTFPTTYTINYSIGDHVIPGSVTGATDNGNGTYTAAAGSNVELNVSYDSGYEFDSDNSSLDGATASNSNQKFTFSSISANKTISIAAKLSNFTVNVQTDGNGGGTVSPSSFTNVVPESSGHSISAVPDTAQSYVFAGWTASPEENITFADASSATTTFTAHGAATITASFTQETLYSVTVKTDGSTETTVLAGNTINPTVTCADRSADDYEFTGWTLSGNVQLAAGYSASNPTIKIKATGNGGTVTANYNHVNYIYFYAGVQDSWQGKAKVKIGSSENTAVEVPEYNSYKNVSTNGTYNNGTGSIAIYDESNNLFGNSSNKWYFTGIFRVDATTTGNIYVGANATYVDCGTFNNSKNGYGYFVYNQNNEGQAISNTCKVLPPQGVTSVLTNKNDYDGDETVTVTKSEKLYKNTKTSGQDAFTYTYKLVSTSGSSEIVLGSDLPSSTSSYDFVPDNKSIPAGNYKVVISTKDSTTGKIVNTCESAAFDIRTTPTKSAVSFSQSLANAHSSFTGAYTYKSEGSSAFNSGATLRANSAVTLTLALNAGYTVGTFTTSGIDPSAVTASYNSSDNTVTLTFNVPSGGQAISITYTADEIKHSVDVIRRFYRSDGTTLISTDASPVQTVRDVGCATAKTVNAAGAVTDYEFKAFVIPEGVAVKTGDPYTADSFTITATADNAVIYLEYKEVTYTIGLENDGHGSVKRGGTEVSSTLIGNVTPVTLVAANNQGYAFKEWQITGQTATSVVINNSTKTLSSTAITVDNSQAPAETTFKFNGTATVKAIFEPVAISVSAVFNSTLYDSGNTVRVTNSSGALIQSGHIYTTYIVEVTLADGYQVKDITGTGISMPEPSNSGNVWKYSYTFNSEENITATVTLSAIKPKLENVQIKDKTFEYKEFAEHAVVSHYFNQPDNVKAETDSFATLSFTNGSDSKTASPAELNPPTVTINSEDATAEYTLTVTATNSKTGVDTETESYTYTIKVEYNEAQKLFFRLSKLMSNCVENPNQSYFKSAEKLNAYNTEYATAKTKTMPAYNATEADKTAMQNVYNAFNTAYINLGTDAKTTTVYALTNYAVNSSYPVNFKAESNGNSDDMAIFKMFTQDVSPTMYAGNNLGDDSYHMNFDGTYNKSGNHYLYKITYTGHVNFRLWVGGSSSDSSPSGKYLTSAISSATDFGGYYVNVYNTTAGSSPSVNSCSAYREFTHTSNSGKKYVELGESKTAQEIKDMFKFTPAGSMIDNNDPGIETTNVKLTVKGPVGKPKQSTYVLVDTDTPSNVVANFPADKQGRYEVTYITRFGKNADGSNVDKSATASLWVAFDDIDIYVDMNDNVGIPILNFKYYANSSGTPVTQGTSGAAEAYLPYEMNLVTGSESIYKYTIKLSKLNTDYKIPKATLAISYIMAEGEYIDGGGRYATTAAYNRAATKIPFSIAADAHITGEMWLKADSTNLTTFNTLSYGTVTNSFFAVTEDNEHTLINAAVKSVHGTGIHTDDDEIYHTRYAGLYTLEGASAPMYNFGYVMQIVANNEVTSGGNKYYFDKWVKLKTPEEGITVENGKVTTELTDVQYSDSTDLNFTKATDYEDGNYTYAALYKPVGGTDTPVQVEITYHFKDYNTSDGNYIYDANKPTTDSSYTKTVKVTGTYTNAVTNIDTIARENVPYIVSNYFDYEYPQETSAVVDVDASKETENKIVANATLSQEARLYTIIAKYGTKTKEYTGYYQQTAELNASDPALDASGISNPAWVIVNNTDNGTNEQVVATGGTAKLRFVSSGNEKDGSADCQVVKLVSRAGAVGNTSVVSNSFTEVYYNESTQMLRHNFYIIDYCEKDKLKGGGVVFATTKPDGTYRQSSATDNLTTKANRESFISGILNGDYSTEYKAQTIKNIGFRYTPNNEEIFRYSGELSAYLTVYEGTNVNSVNYQNQNLRLFSFMVYEYEENGETKYKVECSDGYAEVSRYLDTSQL